MKKTNLESLAKEIDISKSTVSKTLNNCFGVSPYIRKLVLADAEKFGYTSQKKQVADIYIIMPDTPKYFWHEAYKGIKDSQGKADCKYNVYSMLNNEELVEKYIVQAIELHAKVLIASIPMNKKINELLQLASKTMFIIFLEEYHNMENTFFVGSNDYESGYLLGQTYAENFSNRRCIVGITTVSNYNLENRTKGFLDAISAKGMDYIGTVACGNITSISGAIIARKLKENFENKFDCLFCNDGILSQASLAVQKLKCDAICVGYENPETNQKYIDAKIIGAYCKQNVYEQGKKAIQLADFYLKNDFFPSNKNTYIPSQLFLNTLFDFS